MIIYFYFILINLLIWVLKMKYVIVFFMKLFIITILIYFVKIYIKACVYIVIFIFLTYLTIVYIFYRLVVLFYFINGANLLFGSLYFLHTCFKLTLFKPSTHFPLLISHVPLNLAKPYLIFHWLLYNTASGSMKSTDSLYLKMTSPMIWSS